MFFFSVLITACLEYAEPHGDDQKSSPVPEKTLPGWFPVVRFPIEQRIEDKKRGIGRQRYPFVGAFLYTYDACPALNANLVWALSTVMVAVFIYELVVNARAQGTPVSFKVCCWALSSQFCTMNNPIAGRQSYARSIFKCSHQCRGSVSSLHEASRSSTPFIATRMYG
jgi:hypothetical protein